MHRIRLLENLDQYSISHVEETQTVDLVKEFVLANTHCFERSLDIGHITGSAWIVNKDRTEVCLTHHRKLNIWVQPGGHADGESNILSVALKEAQEETGLKTLRVLSKDIFDIDVHRIPSRPENANHFHYDIRYYFEADSNELPTVSDESHDVAWTPIDEIEHVTKEESVLRMCRKTKKVK